MPRPRVAARTVRRFRDDESGAISVDWVVLTAAIVGMSLAIIATIQDAATDQSTGTGARLAKATVPTIEF